METPTQIFTTRRSTTSAPLITGLTFNRCGTQSTGTIVLFVLLSFFRLCALKVFWKYEKQRHFVGRNPNMTQNKRQKTFSTSRKRLFRKRETAAATKTIPDGNILMNMKYLWLLVRYWATKV